MRTKIRMTLSPTSVKQAQNELLKYKKELLKKCQLFVDALAREGITVASAMSGVYGQYILFERETEPTETGAKAIMYATNTGIIHSQWQLADGTVREADVSPLLMAEFGAGLKANNSDVAKKYGMGTGTFPGQTHASDPEGWWYMDLSGVWHHSYGIDPPMPMEHASIAMCFLIADIAKEVWG